MSRGAVAAKLGPVIGDLTKAGQLLELLLWIDTARGVTRNVLEAAQLNDGVRDTLESYDIRAVDIDFDAAPGLAWVISDTWSLVEGALTAVEAAAQVGSKGGAQ